MGSRKNRQRYSLVNKSHQYRFLAIMISYNLVIVAFLVMSATAWATDWPQFRGPNADGISREKGINKSWQ